MPFPPAYLENGWDTTQKVRTKVCIDSNVYIKSEKVETNMIKKKTNKKIVKSRTLKRRRTHKITIILNLLR